MGVLSLILECSNIKTKFTQALLICKYFFLQQSGVALQLSQATQQSSQPTQATDGTLSVARQSLSTLLCAQTDQSVAGMQQLYLTPAISQVILTFS